MGRTLLSPTAVGGLRLRRFFGCEWRWGSPFWSRIGRRGQKNSTASIKANALVLPRRHYSIPVPFTPNSPAVTCSFAVIRWRRLRRPGPDFHCYQSGRGDWVVPGQPFAGAALIYKEPTVSRPRVFLFSRSLTTLLSR